MGKKNKPKEEKITRSMYISKVNADFYDAEHIVISQIVDDFLTQRRIETIEIRERGKKKMDDRN